MSTPKIIAGLLTVIVASAAFYWFTRKEPEQPPNDRVNSENFRQLQSEMERLRLNMTEAQVESILDLPHRTAGGQIVKEERPDSPDARFVLEELPNGEGGNLLNLYLGPRKQSIAVLLSAEKRIVIAAEYRVRDDSLKYVGPLKANRIRELRPLTHPRFLDDQERREQDEEDKMVEELKDSLSRPTVKPPEPAPQPLPTTVAQPTPPVQPSPQASAVVPSTALPTPEPSTPAPVVPAPIGSAPPTAPVTPVPASQAPSKPQPLQITLPSGKMLTDATVPFGVPIPGQGGGVFGGGMPYQDTHPNGNVRCRYSVGKGKLNGPATTFYDDNCVESTATYVDGELNGVLRVWNEDKERLLYAEYRKNNRDGLVCLWRKNWPWLVQEWSKGALKHENLVKDVDEKPVVLDAAKPGEAEDEEFAQARQQLRELQKSLSRNTDEVKQKARDQFKKEEQKSKATKANPLPGTRNIPR
jgi:antitoxin component YwqK of YwqJK toxin-antitoxin module